ncbi:ATP-binding protein [Xylanibacter oryzae]|uniref:ATP-binding protein n=1 Tax=Xylanibacter oryzae TaxID=185293 RepID=UPI00056166C1|nr:transporter substrate-binding domain-containing protein [Xylanibacter oryzae]
MKKVIVFTVFTVLMILSSLTVRGRNLNSDTIPDVIDIVGNKYYPPCEFINEKGKPDGFCVDVLKEVMKRMHKRYTIRLMSREELQKVAESGKTDLILEMTYNNVKTKSIFYGSVYSYAKDGVVYNKLKEPILYYKQLKNKRVAVEKGSYLEYMLRYLNLNIKVLPVEDLMQATYMLKHLKCDAILCNIETARYIADHNNFGCADVGLPPEKLCLSGTNYMLLTKVCLIVYDLKSEGIYDKIHSKWFERDKSMFYLNIIYRVVTAFAVIIFLFIAFNALLRYKIRKAKRQLERNQHSLAISLHAGEIGIWGYNIEKRRFYNIFCDYFPADGRLYEDELKMFHPDDVNIFADAIQMSIEGNPPEGSICVRMDNTGNKNWRYIEKELHSLRDDKGEVEKIIGTHKDVTESINKENKIKELLKDHEVMFNNTSIGMQYFDADGYLMKINDAACNIFGVSDRQAFLDSRPNLFEYPQLKGYINKNDLHKDNFILYDDFDKYKEFKNYGLRDKTGVHYIETFISPVYTSDNKLLCIVVNNNDLTERETLRKQVEDYAFRMKYVLKSSGILTWKYNPETHKRTSLDGNLVIPEDMEWKDIVQYVADEDKQKFIDLFLAMDQRHANSFSTQINFDRFYVDYRPACYSVEGTPFRNKEGEIEYYIGLSINITRLIDIQKQLEHEKEEAQKADKLKSAFIANVSHEIRTPLNSIIGFSDLLQYTNDEKDKKTFVDIIKLNNERLLKIIDDVLDLSKIESGTMPLSIESVDIEAIFKEYHEVFARQLVDSKVKMIFESTNTKCFIDTDRVRFTQVLTNFLTNAVKYTSEGYIRMGYECVNNGLRIFVEDTGIGIPYEKKDLVFNRFEKLDSFVQGTGLGLSICKDIASLFNGEVGVESKLGKGSTFWMWIPCECRC